MATALDPASTTYVGPEGAADAMIAIARRDLSGFNPTDRLVNLGNGRGGGLYLEVKWRIVWLRQEHPEATIETELKKLQPDSAIFFARVSIPGGGSATGWGSESAGDFRDFIEKAETKAIGRALAALGYGTQFTADEGVGVGGDHGEGLSRATGAARIADSPLRPDERPASRANGLPSGQHRDAATVARANANSKPSDKQLGAVAGLVRDRGIGTRRGPDGEASELEALAMQSCQKWDYREMTRQEISDFITKLQRYIPATPVAGEE